MIIADNLSIKGFATLIDYLYPVGSVYITADNNNPTTRLGGTWGQISEGRFIVGVGTETDADNVIKGFLPGDNAGVYTMTIDASNIPPHFHYVANTDSAYAQDAPTVTSETSVIADAFAVASRAYTLRGSISQPSVGRTSSFGSGTPTPIAITPPSYGLYIWQRIS
jgi:microcystin-dependent protein